MQATAIIIARASLVSRPHGQTLEDVRAVATLPLAPIRPVAQAASTSALWNAFMSPTVSGVTHVVLSTRRRGASPALGPVDVMKFGPVPSCTIALQMPISSWGCRAQLESGGLAAASSRISAMNRFSAPGRGEQRVVRRAHRTSRPGDAGRGAATPWSPWRRAERRTSFFCCTGLGALAKASARRT